MRWLLVAEPALVPRRAHLLLVAEPLQVLGRDVYSRRFRRGRLWMWGFGGHDAIVPVLSGKFRPAPRSRGRYTVLGRRDVGGPELVVPEASEVAAGPRKVGRMDSDADSNGAQFALIRDHPPTCGNWLSTAQTECRRMPADPDNDTGGQVVAGSNPVSSTQVRDGFGLSGGRTPQGYLRH